MLFLRHNIKNILRSPGKSLFYLLLIALLTAVLSIEAGVFLSVRAFLDEADRNYTTVAYLEYRGEFYPGEDTVDPQAANLRRELADSAMAKDQAVKSWTEPHIALGKISTADGSVTAERLRREYPYKDEAVLIIRVGSRITFDGFMTATIEETLYSRTDHTEKQINLLPRGVEFIPGQAYVVHGEFFRGAFSWPHFTPALFTVGEGRTGSGGTGSSEDMDLSSMALDITADGGWILPEDSIFRAYADTYRHINNSVTIRETGNVDAELPFHQQELQILRGRTFTAEEYRSGARAVILPEGIAAALGLEVGDETKLEMASDPAIPLQESYRAMDGWQEEGLFTVVGVTNSLTERAHEIYVPAGAFGLSEHQYGYNLATAVLENDRAAQWYREYNAALPAGVQLTIYDQGYEQVTGPVRQIRSSALLLLAVSSVMAFLILLLFAYLMVYRSRGNARVLTRLGISPAGNVRFLLWSPFLLAFAAVILGIFAGRYFAEDAVRLVRELTAGGQEHDLRYSVSRLTVTRDMSFTMEMDERVFLLTAAMILILTMLLALVYALAVVNPPRSKKRLYSPGRRIRQFRRSRSLKGGAIKYAGLSAARGGLRSLLPFLAPLGAVLLLLELSGSTVSYGRQREAIYRDSTIPGSFTTLKGTQFDDIIVSDYNLRDLNGSGYIEDLSVSRNESYLTISLWREDEPYPTYFSPLEREEEYFREAYEANKEAWDRAGLFKSWEKDTIDIKASDFDPTFYAVETIFDNISSMPELIGTNNLEMTPAWLGQGKPAVTYMEGWDESLFTADLKITPPENMWQSPVKETAPAIVSVDYLEEHQLDYGDHIMVLLPQASGRGTTSVVLRIVGTYDNQASRDHIYAPLALFVSPKILTHEGYAELQTWELESLYTFDSAAFSVTSGSRLGEFKNWLRETGFSQVRQIGLIREFVVLDDLNYMLSLASIDQHLAYTGLLYPIIYALVIALGIIMPLLLVMVRRRELSVMRQTGTPPLRRFFSLYLELGGLGFLGAALAYLALSLDSAGQSDIGSRLSLVFLLCWLMGTALALLLMEQRRSFRYAGEGE